MRCTGRSVRAIAQQEQRCAAFRRTQTETSAGGEIEQLGRSANIGDNAGNRPASQRLLGHPEQILHVTGPHDDKLGRIQPKTRQPRPIGQAEELSIGGKLEIEHRQPLRGEQGTDLPQCKPQARPAIAHRIGAHILQQTTRQARKTIRRLVKGTCPHLGQRRLALDIGNGVPQRGKALLAILGLHDAMSCMNKTGTFRLRIFPESSPFCLSGCGGAAPARSRPRERANNPIEPTPHMTKSQSVRLPACSKPLYSHTPEEG